MALSVTNPKQCSLLLQCKNCKLRTQLEVNALVSVKISKVLLLSLCLLATKRNLFSSQLLVCGPFCSSTPRNLSFPSQHCCFVCYLSERSVFLLITTYIPFVMTNRAMLSVINSMLSVNLHTFCTLDFFFQFVCFVLPLLLFFGVCFAWSFFLSLLFFCLFSSYEHWPLYFLHLFEFCLLLTSTSTSMLTSMVALASFDEQFHWIYVQYLFLS